MGTLHSVFSTTLQPSDLQRNAGAVNQPYVTSARCQRLQRRVNHGGACAQSFSNQRERQRHTGRVTPCHVSRRILAHVCDATSSEVQNNFRGALLNPLDPPEEGIDDADPVTLTRETRPDASIRSLVFTPEARKKGGVHFSWGGGEMALKIRQKTWCLLHQDGVE